MVKCIAAGNLALSTAIYFYGYNYTKVANMAELLNLPILSESSFHSLQKEYTLHMFYNSRQ